MERLPEQEPEKLTGPEWDQLAEERLHVPAGHHTDVAERDSEEFAEVVEYIAERNKKENA
jgi:hypothetical protein